MSKRNSLVQGKVRKNSKIGMEKGLGEILHGFSESSYNDSGFTHQLITISRKIASQIKIPSSCPKTSLDLIQSTFKQLALNEIEAALFCIYLENLGFQDSDFSIEQKILFTGLLAKTKLNSSSSLIKSIKAQLSMRNADFLKQFSTFEKKNSSLVQVNALEINEKYSSFFDIKENDKLCNDVEYNYLVDEILKTSVSYNLDRKTLPSPKQSKQQKSLKAKSIKKKKSETHVITNKLPVKRPSATNSTIPLFPYDSSIFFGQLNMERAESFSSDFLSLSRGTSYNEQLKKIVGIEQISSRRSSDSNARGFYYRNN